MSDKVDLVINGGTIVSPDASYRASIAIKDGVIHAIGAPEAMPPATQILDVTWNASDIRDGVVDVRHIDEGEILDAMLFVDLG